MGPQTISLLFLVDCSLATDQETPNRQSPQSGALTHYFSGWMPGKGRVERPLIMNERTGLGFSKGTYTSSFGTKSGFPDHFQSPIGAGQRAAADDKFVDPVNHRRHP